MKVNVKFPTSDIILRTVDEKDFIVLKNTSINLHNNNAVLESTTSSVSMSYLMNKYQSQYDMFNGLSKSHNSKPIHLLSENFLIILYSPVVERLELDDNRLKINIVADYVEEFFEPNIYLRKFKIEKIKENISDRKKDIKK